MLRAAFRKPLTHIILIAVLGLIVYSNTFNVPFQWDEYGMIVDNPIVKDLRYFRHPSDAKGFGELYYSFRDRYMGYLTFALNYRLHGLDVKGYHVVNIALHLLNSLLVYALLRLTLRTPIFNPSQPPLKLRGGEGGVIKKGDGGGFYADYIPLFVALIFVSHPIQTEAVNYIMGRLPLLTSFFYLNALVLYAKWRLTSLTLNPSPTGRGQGVRVILYLVSLLSTVLAMKTKENAFTLPFAIALYEFMFFTGAKEIASPPARNDNIVETVIARKHPELVEGATKQSRTLRNRVLYLLPFMLTLLIIPLSLMSFDKPVDEVIGSIESASRHYTDVPRMSYLFTQFRVLVTYLRLLFLPIDQNLAYDYPVYKSFFALPVLLSFLFLLLIFVSAVYLFYRSGRGSPLLRLSAFGVFWFFLALSVESSIFPIPVMIQEYRVYLPSVGMFLAAISLAAGKFRKYVVPSVIGIVIVFSFASYRRNAVWQSGISMWEDIVKKSLGEATVHYNLGIEYSGKGMTDSAIEQYLLAIKIRPHYADAHNNLGNAYARKGLTDKAIEHLLIASRLRPDDAETHYNLGLAYYNKGLIDNSIEYSRTAIRLRPDFADAYNNLALSYESKAMIDKAVENYQTAIKLRPDDPKAYYNLGLIYFKKGLRDKARKEFERAVNANPQLQ